MHRTLRFVGLLSSLIASAVASSVGAQPVLRYTWADPSNTTINQDWAGPHPYAQTLTVAGLSGDVSSIQLTVLLSIHVPEAWDMAISGPAPAPDCKGSTAFTVSPVVAGTQTIPGSAVSAVGRWFGLTEPRPEIDIMATFDPPFTADPAVRYAIATLNFDHAHSAIGPLDPAACNQADLPFCFVVAGGVLGPTLRRPGFVGEPIGVESGLLSWQNAVGAVDCDAAVPVRAATWGRLKAIYR